MNGIFLSTPSVRRATKALLFACFFDFISIHALREEGDGNPCADYAGNGISIHALREEGDDYIPGFFQPIQNFYPRPP